MTEMSRKDSIARFNEHMKRAVSRVHELAAIGHNAQWRGIAVALDALRDKGLYLADAKSISRTQIESELAAHQKTLIPKRMH